MSARATYAVFGLVATVVVASLVGCGGSYDVESAISEVNATNAQRLATLYVQHRRENRGNAPKDKTGFQKYISAVNPAILERIGVDPADVDGLFVSERDGEPLKVRYGVKGNDRSPPEPVVFESVGVDGVWLVAFTGQKVEEVSDEAEYKRLLGNAK